MKNDIINSIPNYDGIGIYALTNNINGKVYIGSSVNINRRIKQHQASFMSLHCSKAFIPDLKEGHTFSAKVLEKLPYKKTTEFSLRTKESQYIKNTIKSLGKEKCYNKPPSYIDPAFKKKIIYSPKLSAVFTCNVSMKFQKEKYEEIKTAADAAGESINGYIKSAIDQRMERDQNK